MIVFFFKQKTAYEMRISDWSSDVCSSDLPRNQAFAVYAAMTGIGSVAGLIAGGVLTELSWRLVFLINVPIGLLVAIGAIFVLDRKSVVSGKSVSVRVDLGGRRIIKKNTNIDKK